MISAKSYAAHLTGLCVAMEYEGSPELLRILFRWRSDHVEFVLAGTHEEIKRYLKR